MKRLLFNAFAAMSLVLCLSTATLWIRSYWIKDLLFWGDAKIVPVPHEEWLDIACSSGGILMLHNYHEYAMYGGKFGFDHSFSYGIVPQDGYPYCAHSSLQALAVTDVYGYGFQFVYFHDRYNRTQGVTFPLAIIFLPSLFLPTQWLRRETNRRRQSKHNLCPTCNYDLRATPQGGRCPECGTIPQNPVKASA